MNFTRLRLRVLATQIVALSLAGMISFYLFPFALDPTETLGPLNGPLLLFGGALGVVWIIVLQLLWNPSEFTSNVNLFRPVSIGKSALVVIAVSLLTAYPFDENEVEANIVFIASGCLSLLVFYIWKRRALRRKGNRTWLPGGVIILGDEEARTAVSGMLSRVDSPRLSNASTPDRRETVAAPSTPSIGHQEESDVGDKKVVRKPPVTIFGGGDGHDRAGLRDAVSHIQRFGGDSLVVTGLGPESAESVDILLLEEETLVVIRGARTSPYFRALKRAIDVAVSSALLIVLSPVFLIIALGVRFSSPGPIIYRSERIGFHEQPFTMCKFRTMRELQDEDAVVSTPAEALVGPVLAKNIDRNRITPFGRFLRISSLDELPQLWNVLRGDMSLVGPRPHLEREIGTYPPDARERASVRPGMTGLWQINGRSLLGAREAIELDLVYVANQSIWLDLNILVRTIPAVLTARGAF